MEFGKHIGKGLWAFGDKALPAIYGVGFIFLVIRVLPESEFGVFALLQTMFLISSSSLYALTIQPLIKFLSEGSGDEKFLMASLMLQILSFFILTAVILLANRSVSYLLDPNGESRISDLMIYLPPMLALSYYRSLVISILQVKYLVKNIFFVDAVYFIGMLSFYVVANSVGMLRNAVDILNVNILGLFVSCIAAYILSKGVFTYRVQFDRDAMIQFWNYGKYNFGGSFTSLVFSQADTFIVSAFMGIVPTATYSATKILNKVFDVLNQVIQMFLVPFCSRRDTVSSNKELRAVAGKTIAFSTILLLPMLIVMVAAPKLILGTLYGNKYLDGSRALQIFALFGLVVPWNSVVVSYLQGMGRVRQGFMAGILLLMVSSALYLFLTPVFGLAGAAMGMFISFLLFTVGLRRYLSSEIDIRFKDVIVRSLDAVAYIKNIRGNAR